MRGISSLCWAGLSVLAAGTAAAQQASPPPSADVHFETQFQFTTTSIDEDDGSRQPSSTFEFRRVRTYFDITINDWITGAVEGDIAMGRLSARKVFMDLAFSDAFALKLGQDKKPFSLLELTSSSKLPVIESGVRMRGLSDALEQSDSGVLTTFRGEPLIADEQNLIDALLYKGYELGVTAHGELGRFGYAAGVYNGTGIDRLDDNDGKSFAARGTYSLDMERPLTLGLGVSHRELNFPAATDSTTRSGTAFEGDVEWGAFRTPGPWLLAEVATGSNIATGDRFRGATAIVTWFVPREGRVEGLEPVFRAGFADPNDAREDDHAVMLTTGANLYFTGRNKLSVNWDVFKPMGSTFVTRHAVRAQAQLYM